MEQMEAAALLMSAVAVVTAAFRRMGWNPVLGLIAAGVALGPHGFKSVSTGGAVAHLAELGVLFLLFLIGLELSADRIRSMARYVFGLGTAHFVLCAALLGGLAWLMGEGKAGAAVLGVALAMSSTAFVLQTLSDTGQIAGSAGRKSFSVLLFQDIMVAPILAGLPLLVALVSPLKQEAAGHAEIALPVAVIVMVIIFVVARLVLQQLIGYIHEDESDPSKKSHERSSYFFAAVISAALSMGVAAHHLGLSASIGAFLAGLALSGAEWRHAAKETVKPLESTLLGIFFLSLGAQVPLSASPRQMALMAGVACAVIGAKMAAGFLAAVANGVGMRCAVRVGLVLAQAGEFSFVVLASTGAAVMPPASADFWSGVAVLSLVATPLLVGVAGRIRDDGAAEEPAAASARAEPPQAAG